MRIETLGKLVVSAKTRSVELIVRSAEQQVSGQCNIGQTAIQNYTIQDESKQRLQKLFFLRYMMKKKV